MYELDTHTREQESAVGRKIGTPPKDHPSRPRWGRVLFGLGAFAAIYHPVGIAMLVASPKNLGMALGWNGLWGNLGVSLLGFTGAIFVLQPGGAGTPELSLAAALTGAVEGAYELTRAYVNTREQFGRPLARIPAVAAKLAIIKTSVIQCDAALARAYGGTLAAAAAARIIAAMLPRPANRTTSPTTCATPMAPPT